MAMTEQKPIGYVRKKEENKSLQYAQSSCFNRKYTNETEKKNHKDLKRHLNICAKYFNQYYLCSQTAL